MRRAVAVVVTWNRLDLLRDCLGAVLEQTHAPDHVIVVDNASTDGTRDWLAETFDADDRVTVITMRVNVGGAGGFVTGMTEALGRSPEVVWVLDDDARPAPDALDHLVRAWEDHEGTRPSVVSSRIVWTDGREQPANTPRPRRVGAEQRRRAAAVGGVPIRSASFVSALLDAESMRQRGLPIADYFLWNDDFEYTARLLKDGVGLSVAASEVVHRTAEFGDDLVDPGDRFYFEVRNKIWVFTRSRCLRWGERVVFVGATLMRWMRIWWRSNGRGVLWSRGWRGVRDGVRAPQANTRVLRDARLTVLTEEPLPFSLLMSTWARDDPQRLAVAVHSATSEQTRRPAELVLVQDGPVTVELAAVIDELQRSVPVPVRHLVRTQHGGLGPALQAGLLACEHEIVARMDTDDVSLPHRFEVQIRAIEEGADIVGAWLLEYGDDPDHLVGQRRQPTAAEPIRRVMRFRDAFNHPTVVYRKSAVIASGGYPDLHLMEDYLLFARMLKDGAVPANVGESLVLYRAGRGTYRRRGGWDLLRSEVRLQRRLRHLRITSRYEYVRNLLVRGGYRLAPVPMRRFAYRRVFRPPTEPVGPSVDFSREP